LQKPNIQNILNIQHALAKLGSSNGFFFNFLMLLQTNREVENLRIILHVGQPIEAIN
jgi:hypothetical protein